MNSDEPTTKQFLTTVELAERINSDVKTIQQWRYRGNRGPKWYKLGGLVRYLISDVEKWEAANERTPTEV